MPPLSRRRTSLSESKTDGSAQASSERKGLISQIRSLSMQQNEEQPAWIPTWMRILPLIGIGSLLVATSCVVASMALLVGSDGQSTETWPWSPSVFLAMFAAVCNTTVQFALAQAAPLAWWYYASRGNTLQQLHTHWEASQGFFRAVMNARHAKLVALATILSALLVIDGPLLQKASSVVSKTQTKPATLQILLSPELPAGWSGIRDSNGIEPSEAANQVLNEDLANSTVSGNISGCTGKCLAAVRGPGVLVQNCTTKTWPITPEMLSNSSSTWGSGYKPRKISPKPVFAVQLYESSLRPNFTGPEEIELLVGIANFTNCSGQYDEVICTLVPAILEYDIIIKHDIVDQSTLRSGKFLSVANNSFINSSEPIVPLAFTSFAAFLDPQFFSNASLGPSDKSADRAGNISVPLQDTFNVFSLNHALHTEVCESAFHDPTEDILARFNTIMFRAGLQSAAASANTTNNSTTTPPPLTSNQTIPANQTLTLNVFHSDLKWFGAAALIEFLAILAVVPIFYGYWTLGIKISLSPLETAKAFGAPLMGNVNSATGCHGIVKRMGGVRVRFGAVADGEVGEEEMGREGEGEGRPVPVSARLAIEEWERVVVPVGGMRFNS